MKNARAVRVISNARPVVRTMLMTTAVAWSVGVSLPDADVEPGPRQTVLAQSISSGQHMVPVAAAGLISGTTRS